MSRLPDEQWAMIEDSIEKKNIARSSRNRRTHNGKSGSVKFPSDFMTKKELKAMNSDVKSYRMNEPMVWDEFKKLPDDLKVVYVKSLREKYNISAKELANYMGVNQSTFGRWLKCLGLSEGKSSAAKYVNWEYTKEHDEFVKWWTGVDTTKPKTEAAPIDIPEKVKEVDKSVLVSAVPETGSLTFDCNAEDALRTINAILGNTKVCLHVEWTVAE